MAKKELRYIGPIAGATIQVGSRAQINVLDPHPNFDSYPGQWISTSKVIRVEDNGDFETLNTVYRKAKPEELEIQTNANQ